MEINYFQFLIITLYWTPCVYINLCTFVFFFKKTMSKEGLCVPAAIIVFFVYLLISLIPIFNFALMFTISTDLKEEDEARQKED